MKIFRIIVLGLWIGVCACSEDDLSGYESDSYIYFSKKTADSTIFSFAYDKSQTVGNVDLKLNIVSNIEDRNRAFAVQFLPEESTAVEGTHFELPESGQFVMANDSVGYFKLTVKKGDLGNNYVLAVFELVDTDDFKVGLKSNKKARVIISNQLNRPEWWNSWHETDGLGLYSTEKYQAFIEEMGIYDLTQEKDGGTLDYSEVRVLILKFKRILVSAPRLEADGSTMTVEMKG